MQKLSSWCEKSVGCQMMRKHVLCIFFERSCFKIRPTPPWTAKRCLVKRRDEKVSEIGNGVVFPDAAKKAKVDLAFLVIEAVSEAKKFRSPLQAAGYQNSAMISVSKLSPPNVFIGGPVRTPPGFPLKACGNDGIRIRHCAASWRGISDRKFNKIFIDFDSGAR